MSERLLDIYERDTRMTPEDREEIKQGLRERGVLRHRADALLGHVPAPGRAPRLAAPRRRFRIPPLALEAAALTAVAALAWVAVDLIQGQPEPV